MVFVERLRYLGGLPLSLDLTYLEPDIGTQVLTHSLESNDIFALIEQLTGRRLGRGIAGAGGDSGRRALRRGAAGARRRPAADAGTADQPGRRQAGRLGVHPDAW